MGRAATTTFIDSRRAFTVACETRRKKREPFLLTHLRACERVPPQCPARPTVLVSGIGKGIGSKTAVPASAELSAVGEKFSSRDSRVDGRNLAVTSDKASDGVARRLLRPGGAGGGGDSSSSGDSSSTSSSNSSSSSNDGSSGGSFTRGYVAAASMTLL